MRVLLVPNLGNPAAVTAAAELVTWLSAESFEPVLVTEDALGVGIESCGVARTQIGEPGLVIALGGDGTILKAVHMLGETEAPILGVNFGKLGFLAGASAESMRSAIVSALAGDVRVERRATLEARVYMGGREVGRYQALNEVALVRGTNGRVVEIEIAINEHTIQTMRCDGVIVATPTGSTAYALSAGGPVVSPEVGCNVLVPVAPHSLAGRALVLGSSDVVTLTLPDTARRDACLQVDGDITPCRRDIERVVVQRCASDVLLVRLDGRDFFEVVSREFLGG